MRPNIKKTISTLLRLGVYKVKNLPLYAVPHQIPG
jgi:hypothetical protein